MSIVNEFLQNSNENLFKNKDYQMIAPRNEDGTSAVNSDTIFIAYNHAAYSGDKFNNHMKELNAEYGDNSRLAWLSPTNQNNNDYFNTVPAELNIPPKNIIYSGSSLGGNYVLPELANSIMENPEDKNRKAVFFEPVISKHHPYKLSDEQIQSIKNNGATMFLVDSGEKSYGNFAKNIKANELTTPDSDARIFHIKMNFSGDPSKKHNLCCNGGVSPEFGLMDLISGDGTNFYNNSVLNADNLTYKGIKYSPTYELLYKGKKITFNSAEDFYNYYEAVENVNVETDPLERLNFLKTMYDVEHTGEAVTDLVRNVASLVNSSMNDFNACINRIEKINTICTLSNPLGLAGIIEETGEAYNNTVDSFKTFMGEFTSLGIDASSRYESLDEDLDNSAGNIN